MRRRFPVLAVLAALSACGRDARPDWVGSFTCTNSLAVADASGSWSGPGSVAPSTTNSRLLVLTTTLRRTQYDVNHDYPTTFDLNLFADAAADVVSGGSEISVSGCRERLTVESGQASRDASGAIATTASELSLVETDDVGGHCASTSVGAALPGTYLIHCTPTK